MADMFEYLKWRGDISFDQMGINDVDALILATIAYVEFDGLVADDLRTKAPLSIVVKTLLAMPDAQSRVRVPQDLDLLRAVAETDRFDRVGITYYRSVFIPEEETQFAAMTFLLEDGSSILTFRGTDNTLVGWKEDFNMAFQDSIPAQRLACEYVRQYADAYDGSLYLCGHSKGGNLSVYAATKSNMHIQARICAVYNFDGPGFMDAMMQDPGYQRCINKIKTFLPQSSVFGMMLEHEEPFAVIRSKSVGILQHEPYSWEVMGKSFVLVDNLTAESRYLDKVLTMWLAGLSVKERNEFIDAIFDLFMLNDAKRPLDIIRPQHLHALIKTIQMDDERRNLIGSGIRSLLESVRQAHDETNDDALQLNDRVFQQ